MRDCNPRSFGRRSLDFTPLSHGEFFPLPFDGVHRRFCHAPFLPPYQLLRNRVPVLGVRVGGFPRHFGMYKNRYLDPPKNFAKSIFSLGSSVLRGWVLLSPEPVHLADCLLRALQDLTSPRSLKLKPFLRSLKGSEVSIHKPHFLLP